MVHQYSPGTNRWCTSTHLEPINGTAVDERRKLPQPVPEGVTDGTHRQHDVQLIATALNEEIEERHRRAVGLFRLVALPVELSHLRADLLLLVERKQVGYLAGVQQVVDVFEERFLLDL